MLNIFINVVEFLFFNKKGKLMLINPIVLLLVIIGGFTYCIKNQVSPKLFFKFIKAKVSIF